MVVVGKITAEIGLPLTRSPLPHLTSADMEWFYGGGLVQVVAETNHNPIYLSRVGSLET